ncbi:uncharacterized protein LOC121038989 isoform X2 [Herpailurus yagouaroundi]|uniref:uncharacterized protein LOC121038989 isoform X2 n=1 Tax=Herpailurus yagouaroundi TaxID=1608482 RepID=UPI001AD78514|nr:uncharacterized protein LOC121038989 isoform X2 [Puma yagouaroundi]
MKGGPPRHQAPAESHQWRLPEQGGGVESRPGRRKAHCPQLAPCAFQEVTRRDVGASQPKALGARRDETGPGACGQVSSGRTQPGPGVPSPSPARAPPAFLSSVGLLASRPGGFFLTCQGSTHPTHAARGETRPTHTPVSILSCCTGVKFTSVPRPPPRSSWIERTTAGHRQGALLIAPCTGHMLGLGTQCPQAGERRLQEVQVWWPSRATSGTTPRRLGRSVPEEPLAVWRRGQQRAVAVMHGMGTVNLWACGQRCGPGRGADPKTRTKGAGTTREGQTHVEPRGFGQMRGHQGDGRGSRGPQPSSTHTRPHLKCSGSRPPPEALPDLPGGKPPLNIHKTDRLHLCVLEFITVSAQGKYVKRSIMFLPRTHEIN